MNWLERWLRIEKHLTDLHLLLQDIQYTPAQLSSVRYRHSEHSHSGPDYCPLLILCKEKPAVFVLLCSSYHYFDSVQGKIYTVSTTK
jgi:hypothetical protein